MRPADLAGGLEPASCAARVVSAMQRLRLRLLANWLLREHFGLVDVEELEQLECTTNMARTNLFRLPAWHRDSLRASEKRIADWIGRGDQRFRSAAG